MFQRRYEEIIFSPDSQRMNNADAQVIFKSNIQVDVSLASKVRVNESKVGNSIE